MVPNARSAPTKTLITRPGIEEYAARHTSPEPAALAAVAAETRATLEMPEMLCGRVVAALLQALVHALRPRLVLEVGTFSGYSALAMAMALPPDGRLVTCEIDPTRAEVARRHFATSPYRERISLRVGPAMDTIESLPGPVDLAFIDADKPSYPSYLEAVLGKLSEHGLIVCDNTLWNGEVLEPDAVDGRARALHAFNQAVAADPRIHCTLLTVRDGVTLIRKG